MTLSFTVIQVNISASLSISNKLILADRKKGRERERREQRNTGEKKRRGTEALIEIIYAKLIQFLVVGGGPVGVDLAAELRDFVVIHYRNGSKPSYLTHTFPVIDGIPIGVLIKLTIMCLVWSYRFETRSVTTFAEEKFSRDGIQVKTGPQVVKVAAAF